MPRKGQAFFSALAGREGWCNLRLADVIAVVDGRGAAPCGRFLALESSGGLVHQRQGIVDCFIDRCQVSWISRYGVLEASWGARLTIRLPRCSAKDCRRAGWAAK